MKKLFKVISVPLIAILLLTACIGGSNITTGQIPPPPPRQPVPEVSPPATPPAGGTTPGVIDTTTPDADVITLSFSHNTNTGHPRGYMIERFAQLVEQRSGGRLVINVFPGSQLGNDAEVMAQIMQGTIDLTSLFSPNMTHIVPELALFDLPYLFFTMEQAHNALEGTLGDFLAEAMAEQGLISFGYLTSGFKDLTNNVRPIHSVQDLDGLLMRVSQSHFLVAQFQAINAGGISIPFGELPAAFEAGLADGQENPLATIVASNIYQVQNYITISNHGFTAYPIVMSAEVYNQLPADLRLILHQAFAEIQPLQWQLIEETAEDHLEFLHTTDIAINYLSDTARQNFRTTMQVIYDEFAQLPRGAELLSIVERYVD
ncbi:MAG: TRAP transporter substrate-binding protein [Defluviitaleaceae bacterium]|nr:TRAP transporter substrate-binding protein [Defluviitaleaceae bacterium]